jgi:rsbT co-antagonist protein RsbR
MNSHNNISNHLLSNKESLAIEIVNGVLNSLNLDIPKWEQDQAVTMFIEFVSFISEYIISEEEKTPELLLVWSKKNAAMITLDGNLSTLVVRYLPTREVITDILTELGLEYNLSLKELSKLIKQVNRMLDISLNETVSNFEFLVNECQKMAQIELAEVSTPIVPVKDGIIVLPLVGNIDSYRIQYMMENLLPKMSDLGVNCVIADFSGVYKLDKENVKYLNQIGQMLRLMGIDIISTGISPKLSQLAINEGIDLSGSKVYSNLKIALESFE